MTLSFPEDLKPGCLLHFDPGWTFIAKNGYLKTNCVHNVLYISHELAYSNGYKLNVIVLDQPMCTYVYPEEFNHDVKIVQLP